MRVCVSVGRCYVTWSGVVACNSVGERQLCSVIVAQLR